MNQVALQILKSSAVVFLLACNHTNPEEEKKYKWLENVDYTILQKQVISDLKQVSDSQTWQRYNLNFYDSVKWNVEQEKFTKKWLEQLVKKQFLLKLNQFIQRAHYHGLDSNYYHAGFLSNFQSRLDKGEFTPSKKFSYTQLSQLIILSSDASLGLYHDLSAGRVNPSYTGSIDVLPRRICRNLKTILRSDSLEKAMNHAFPTFKPYTVLQQEYRRILLYKNRIDSTYLVVEKPVKIGDTLPNWFIRSLALKLQLWGYGNWPDSVLKNVTVLSTAFGDQLRKIRISQGLPEGNYFDKELANILNIKSRVMLLRLKSTLERWRWLGPISEETKIIANLAENRIYAYKQDTLKLDMNICSGTNRNAEYYYKLKLSKNSKSKVLPPDNLETPLFKAKVTHLVLNPVWYVPRLIAIKEILPLIKQNPGILDKYDYVLRDRDGDKLNPWAVDWNEVTQFNFNYRIEQRAGNENSLGKLVIHFPNAFSIYMHDTNIKWVFGLEDRHISHGCMRLEKPFEMAEFITSFAEKDEFDKLLMFSGQTPKRDKALIKKWETAKNDGDSVFLDQFKKTDNKYFKAPLEIPIYILYQTAFVGKMGGVKYTSDGYKRDIAMMKEMDKTAILRNRLMPEVN